MQPIFSDFIKPPVPDQQLLAQLLEFQSATWPWGLGRFTPFKRERDGDYVIYRSVAWNPYDRVLHVLRVDSGTPKGAGLWERWCEDADDRPLDDIYLVDDTVMPREMKEPRHKLKPSSLKGLDKRTRILQSFAYLDPVGKGNPADFVFNDLVVASDSARSAALNRVVAALGQQRGFQSAVRRLFHKFVHNGGHANALAAFSFRQGNKGMSRVGINRRKTGPKSTSEVRIESRNKAIGIAVLGRRHPVRSCDEVKFIRALEQHWARGRDSLRETYDLMILNDYKKWPKRLIPSIGAFRYHAKRLIRDFDLKRIRNGARLSEQYNDARVGQASHLTQGVIEILDVDGFVAKIGVAARIGARIESVHMTVMFAVSRLSGAILGYELAIRGENAEAFRRCIASVFLPKHERAEELGLSSTDGLLAGNIDAIFVDNGAGASEQVIVAACDEMGLMRMLPPPGRGDLKGVGEGVNSLMILMMLGEDGGYTRKTDHLSKDMRRLKARDKPIPLDQFERLLLQAIQHYNLFTNKRRLRTYAMRKAGVGLNPASIFRYTQAQRRGDAARKLTPREVFERFIPWQSRTCQRGLVNFMSMRYTSEELVDFFNEHARQPGKRVPLPVRVKRLDGHPHILLWQKPNGETAVLNIVDEDARSIGSVTWKGLEFLNADDEWREETLKPGRRTSRSRVTVKVHSQVARADNIRAANEMGGLEGDNVKSARANAETKRNASRGAAQADAYGITNVSVDVGATEPAARIEPSPSTETSYLRRLAQRLTRRKEDTQTLDQR
ncbi:hypothetical protein PQR66_34785 [Paraburkholderia agricolaris]|uniref:Integrase catalytic domain-containing protein n=1 Tax=Paraburkholderia agricolaris TaxID=2152888 RepID=A0ABW8ZYE6_9BURK